MLEESEPYIFQDLFSVLKQNHVWGELIANKKSSSRNIYDLMKRNDNRVYYSEDGEKLEMSMMSWSNQTFESRSSFNILTKYKGHDFIIASKAMQYLFAYQVNSYFRTVMKSGFGQSLESEQEENPNLFQDFKDIVEEASESLDKHSTVEGLFRDVFAGTSYSITVVDSKYVANKMQLLLITDEQGNRFAHSSMKSINPVTTLERLLDEWAWDRLEIQVESTVMHKRIGKVFML